jgi:hypothetical protein
MPRSPRKTARQRPTPEQFLASFPPEVQALAERLRALVRQAVPDSVEAVYPGWKLIGYRRPVQGGSVYFGYVAPQIDRAMLGFEYGVLLEDRHGLLEGSGSQVRYVSARLPGDLRMRALLRLIRQAAEVAALPREVLRERLRDAATQI